jgi:hypothetical protein
VRNSVYGVPTSPLLGFGGSGMGGVGWSARFDGYPPLEFRTTFNSDGLP